MAVKLNFIKFLKTDNGTEHAHFSTIEIVTDTFLRRSHINKKITSISTQPN
jgi:hypothetical protein